MKITVNEKAANWFKEELGFGEGEGVRFKTKLYGSSPFNNGFGLAIETTKPDKPIATYQATNGVFFFIEADDEWFFNGHDLAVIFNEGFQEPDYTYIKDGQTIQ